MNRLIDQAIKFFKFRGLLSIADGNTKNQNWRGWVCSAIASPHAPWFEARSHGFHPITIRSLRENNPIDKRSGALWSSIKKRNNFSMPLHTQVRIISRSKLTRSWIRLASRCQPSAAKNFHAFCQFIFYIPMMYLKPIPGATYMIGRKIAAFSFLRFVYLTRFRLFDRFGLKIEENHPPWSPTVIGYHGIPSYSESSSF